ncbi:MAG: PLD nuclease N-terminal domain-containing protein [Coriobacteriales bacterium]|nr:PLD nuclease N-terminal domain-containing protein [Actinomycetes bacterium]
MLSSIPFDQLPVGARIALGLLAVVQVGLEVFALVTLARTPNDRLVFGMKWPWVVIILLINTVGAIVFLAAGRVSRPAEEPVRPLVEHDATRVKNAADLLYPRKDRESEQS